MNNIIKKFNFPDEICSRIFYFYTTSKHKKELEKYFYNRDNYTFYIGRSCESMSFLNYKNNNYTNIIKTTKYSYTCYNMEERVSELYDDEEEFKEEEDEEDRIQREYEEEIY